MYDELIKRLRREAVYLPEKFSKNAELLDALIKAADAIEELSARLEAHNEWFAKADKKIEEYKAAYIAEHDARIAECKRELMEKEQEAHNEFLKMVAMCGQTEPPKKET